MNDAVIVEVNVTDPRNNRRVYGARVFAENHKQGARLASLIILSQLFGSETFWTVLVNKTSQMVEDNRQKRGAVERPILKTRDEYKRIYAAN